MTIPESLRTFLNQKKGFSFQELKSHFTQAASWKNTLQTEEGIHRLHEFTDILTNYLWLPEDYIIEDHTYFCNKYSNEGVQISELFSLLLFVHNLFHKLFLEAHEKNIMSCIDLIESKHRFDNILMKAHSATLLSVIRRKDDQIDKKINKLESIYYFTKEIIQFSNIDEILKYCFIKVSSLYEPDALHFFEFDNSEVLKRYSIPEATDNFDDLILIANEASHTNLNIFLNQSNTKSFILDSTDIYRIISIPVFIEKHYPSVFLIDARFNGIRFDTDDLIYIQQMLNITAIAISDAIKIEKLEYRNKELLQLRSKLISLREEERKRLAEDIHDTLAQDLTFVGYKLEVLKSLSGRNLDKLNDEIELLIDFINNKIDLTREFISYLRPELIDNFGFRAAIHHLIDNYINQYEFNIILDMPEDLELESEISINLYRVIQEALKNIRKHAEASIIKILFKFEGKNLMMLISDDGKGFDLSILRNQAIENKFGLMMMRERVQSIKGHFIINSAPGEGSRVEIRIPIGKEMNYEKN